MDKSFFVEMALFTYCMRTKCLAPICALMPVVRVSFKDAQNSSTSKAYGEGSQYICYIKRLRTHIYVILYSARAPILYVYICSIYRAPTLPYICSKYKAPTLAYICLYM
jgi:hypothetical protein